jgi:hypothetical protein
MNTNQHEAEVRTLRDQVFGQSSTEKNWAGCREDWMRPDSVAWLREKAKRPLKGLDEGK